MELAAARLKELLVPAGLVSASDFEAALAESRAEARPLWETLVDKDLIKDSDLGKLTAEALGFRWLDLRREKIDPAIFQLVPEIVARRRGVVALSRSADGVKVGLLDPSDLATAHLLEKRLGERVRPYFLTRRDLAEALTNYKGSLKSEFESTLKLVLDEGLGREERDESTIRLVDLLLRYGHQNKASDIHLEPYRDKVLVRFRIDGILHDVLELPKTLSEVVLTRLKILARMRTDEHRAAQDGKLQFAVRPAPPPGPSESGSAELVDVRVSIVPVSEGENAVLRLLSEQSRRFSLADLGLGEVDLGKVKKAIAVPHGMILVTGPTGSGKTTTVYAVVKILNTRDVHISSIEDPVEYDIEGVSQIQVNPKTNLTFASGLRAIVRQDPDIIVVGEIRDEETAGIAVNSALTGHLVLSTLHANDAATTLPRLLDMGIEPFLVASTVNVVAAQRLARKICDRCRISAPPSAEGLAAIRREPALVRAFRARGYRRLSKLTFYRGAGCDLCSQTGYQGRIGIFEVLAMTDEIKTLVVARASANEIVKAAVKNGMTTMLDDGLDKVLVGLTTLDEVLRVTKI